MKLFPRIGNTASRASVPALLALLAWAVIAAPAAMPAQNGGNASVAASLSDASIEAGEDTQYQISVLNGEADQVPPVPQVPGLTIQYAGQQQSQQLNFGNGSGFGMTSRTIYTYLVRAGKPGRYIIPGQGVLVNGSTVRTLPVTLDVEGSADGATPPGQKVSIELLVPKKTAYVGESIPIEVRAYFGLAIRSDVDVNPILNGAGFSAQKFTPPRVSLQVVDGVRFKTAIYRSAIAGVKTGPLTVGPVDTAPTIQLPRAHSRRAGGNDPFTDPFFGNGFGQGLMQQPQQIKVSSEPSNVEILPLPPGRPEGFSGGIGHFKLEVEAVTRQGQVGDPITVRLVLSGEGNFDRINAPALADERGLRTYPPSSRFKADDEVNLSGIKTFEQVVIADGPRDSLPGYRFSYLDPATGKYVSIDTPPVAVKITGAAVTPKLPVTAGSEASPAATPAPAPVPRKAEDILYIRTDAVGTARDRTAFLPVYQRRAFWEWQTLPLVGLLGAVAVLLARARGRDEEVRRIGALQRQQAELQRALRTETTARRDFYAAATRLAQLRSARDRSGTHLTASEICQTRRLDPSTADSVQAIFHRHDELAYSGGQAATEAVPAEERRGVLATLEALEKPVR